MSETEFYLGSITGTSVDGLDIALIEVSAESIHIAHAETAALPDKLADSLRALASPGPDELDRLGYADASLGEFIGNAVNAFIDTHKINKSAIRAIGSHGQTVRHRPDAKPGHAPFTLQIGDPNRIAEITGITTVADIRRRDMAAGGQGAPLVPPFHKVLFNTTDSTVVLNVGGISNVSILTAVPSGFDTGPGNCLMDEWVAKHQDKAFDAEGVWAKSGRVNDELLNRMLKDPYFHRPAPKSTGREYFHLDWLHQHHIGALAPEDVQATLCELTARCVADALKDTGHEITQLIICGGGRLNLALLKRLDAITPYRIVPCEALGVDGDAIEAAAFGWFAYRALAGQPGNEPAVTGASGYRTLGGIYPA